MSYMLFLIFISFAMMRMERSSVICLSLSITHSFYHISLLFRDVLCFTSGQLSGIMNIGRIVKDCRAMDKQNGRITSICVGQRVCLAVFNVRTFDYTGILLLKTRLGWAMVFRETIFDFFYGLINTELSSNIFCPGNIT